ncbi:MAG TPA: glycosyltransferase family 4 protein [Desulfuromonadales bacterium]|nr:glycosyltransferase family 4 protein [Desulfuromonadales bacterium]
MQRQLAEFRPDVIHGFHAGLCGPIVMQLAQQLRMPYLITITGSDLHDPLLRERPATVSALESAQTIVCFHSGDADRLTGLFPSLRGKVSVIPQGIEPLSVNEDDDFGCDRESFVLLLPAALRPVKQIEFPIRALLPLIRSNNPLKLLIAGGVIDREYATQIFEMLRGTPWAVWLGEVPHDRMGSLYQRADLVLNCSRSESMPNSLLEAMAAGRPILAADIPGNRSLVRHGENGWLYNGEADFRRLVLHAREGIARREEVGRNAKEYVMEHCSPRKEAERYLTLYHSIVTADPKSSAV